MFLFELQISTKAAFACIRMVLPFGRVRKFPETKDKHIRGNDFTAAKYVPVTGSSRSLSGSPPRTWPTRGALRSPSW